ncbi:hypothetical protein BDFB_003218 [Asbolus verrucosus]|uniref:Uncharacterized protein n=1 Tax=Asbolus verrucosus TaxID=1661398 RepID=A0A482WCS7_ASBVE|nr:hypothetical protein BDFB_003218 [Asbolus verrucosus]
MNKFRKFYEDKLREIDIEGGGDCLELKLKLQERWIKDLTEQTEMMAKIVKELEEEATARVRMLEDKLRQTSKAAYEKVFYVENDLKNLLEFIRRIRDDCKWSIDGLQFYDVTYNDLFGREQSCECDETPKDAIVVPVSNGLDSKKDTSCNTEIENSEFEEILKKKAEEYEALKQSMLDMRSALTEEVACKHDMISALKKDVQQLEERCLQADKQTAFKDDIIKELRKEIKQLKQQMSCNVPFKQFKNNRSKTVFTTIRHGFNTEKPRFSTLKKENAEKKSEEVENLEKKLQAAEDKIRQMKPRVIMTTAWTAMDDLSDREKELEDEICRRQCEVEELKCKCSDLEKALESSQARAENLQKAVDLYLNSINVLEASEERARIEIEQQRVTIVNLQEALVTVKQELDEIRQKNQQDVSVGWAARWFGTSTPAPKSNTKSVHDV